MYDHRVKKSVFLDCWTSGKLYPWLAFFFYWYVCQWNLTWILPYAHSKCYLYSSFASPFFNPNVVFDFVQCKSDSEIFIILHVYIQDFNLINSFAPHCFVNFCFQMKEIATENFQRICEAYEILSDENKRQIYDIYGMEGLTSGLELGPKLNKVEELKEELERLRRRKEQEKTLAHFRPSGTILANLSLPQFLEGDGIMRGCFPFFLLHGWCANNLYCFSSLKKSFNLKYMLYCLSRSTMGDNTINQRISSTLCNFLPKFGYHFFSLTAHTTHMYTLRFCSYKLSN